MTEAMQMVREAMGEDAIIVATGEERGSKGVRVTAAIEPAFEIQSNTTERQDWLQYDDESERFAVAEQITDALLRHSVPEDVTDHIISCVTIMGIDEPGLALISAIEQLFNFRPLPVSSLKKPVMMVGPPGSGKTLAVAKMAARGAMSGLNIAVISTDTMRAGGVEQLEAFTKLLKIDLKKAKSPEELRIIVDSLQTFDQVLIDTSGLNPFSTDDVRMLARLVSYSSARPVLVLPGGIDADESGEMARVFSAIGVGELLSTRIDIARRLGGLLAAAHRGSLSLSDASNTPKVAQGLAPMTPKSLARLLMPGAFREAQNNSRIIKGTSQSSGRRQ